MVLFFQDPSPPPPPPVVQDVGQGYAATDACAQVPDPVDLVLCINALPGAMAGDSSHSPDYKLGMAIGLFAKADALYGQMQHRSKNDTFADALKVSSDLTLTALVGVEKLGRERQIDPNRLAGLVASVSGVTTATWESWRSKPLPDWLAKQAGP